MAIAIAACGGGSTGPAPPRSTVPAASPSATTTQADAYVPVSVLTAALITTKQLKGSKVTDAGTEAPADVRPAGFSTGFTLVDGDPGCQQVLDPHDVWVATGSWVDIDAPDLAAWEKVQSMRSEADAKKVMDQNLTQVKRCKKAVVSYKGKEYPATHELLVAGKVGGQTVGLVHMLTIALTSSANLAIVMNERRLGGEMMFLNVYPINAEGVKQSDALMTVAVKRFIKTLDAYRSQNPRPPGA